jgi:RNA polymerase sigma factor (sigma-70 family)
VEPASNVGNRSAFEPSEGSRSDPTIPSVSEWLESRHLSGAVYGISQRRGIQAQEIPDILQEVRISLIRKGLNSRVNATWVFKTITSRIADYYRNRRREVADDGPLPDQAASQSGRLDPELTLLMESKASRLPERLRIYYVLRYRLGLKQSEVANQLGMSRAAVRHLEHQCIQSLAHGAA